MIAALGGRNPARGDDSVNLPDALGRAQQLLAEGRAAEAAAQLNAALGDGRLDARTAAGVGGLLLRLGDAPRAAALLSPLEYELPSEGAIVLARARRASDSLPAATRTITTAIERGGGDEALWLAYIDVALEAGQAAEALQRVRLVERRRGWSAGLGLRAAQAHAGLGVLLGETAVRVFPRARAGQFQGQWLLVQPTDEPDAFLCCRANCALFELRRALDAGLDEPAAHALHAQIWERLGRTDAAWRIARAAEPRLLESGEPALIEPLLRLSLAAGEIGDHLRYAKRLAGLQPARADAILSAAYLAAAERYSQRGEGLLYAEFLRRALERRGQDDALRLRLADAEWELGRRAAARELYDELLRRSPAHPDRGRISRRLAEAAP